MRWLSACFVYRAVSAPSLRRLVMRMGPSELALPGHSGCLTTLLREMFCAHSAMTTARFGVSGPSTLPGQVVRGRTMAPTQLADWRTRQWKAAAEYSGLATYEDCCLSRLNPSSGARALRRVPATSPAKHRATEGVIGRIVARANPGERRSWRSAKRRSCMAHGRAPATPGCWRSYESVRAPRSRRSALPPAFAPPRESPTVRTVPPGQGSFHGPR
jgi:hypothetical protein